jgi:hypothetical protein
VLIFLLWWAGACTTQEIPATVTPVATTTVLTVHIAGELDLLRPALAACAGEVDGTGLVVFEADRPPNPAGAQELTLLLGEPPDGSQNAALLGFEEIVVVASIESGRDALTDAEVRAFFAGQRSWGTGEIWLPQPGLAMRDVLDAFMAGAAYPPEAFLAPSAAAMVEAVSDSPGAVGVLPAAWLTEDLKTVFTLGELPVLALTEGTPQGKLREVIGCLQLGSGYE